MTIRLQYQTPPFCPETLPNPLYMNINDDAPRSPKSIRMIIPLRLKIGFPKNNNRNRKGAAIKFCQNVNEILS